jgi:hypothetical protein
VSDREHLQRVSERIAGAIVAFCERHREFHMAQLTAWVRETVGEVAPDSPGRVLRALRQRGTVSVELVSRRDSLYRVAPRFHVEPSGQLCLVSG